MLLFRVNLVRGGESAYRNIKKKEKTTTHKRTYEEEKRGKKKLKEEIT